MPSYLCSISCCLGLDKQGCVEKSSYDDCKNLYLPGIVTKDMITNSMTEPRRPRGGEELFTPPPPHHTFQKMQP